VLITFGTVLVLLKKKRNWNLSKSVVCCVCCAAVNIRTYSMFYHGEVFINLFFNLTTDWTTWVRHNLKMLRIILCYYFQKDCDPFGVKRTERKAYHSFTSNAGVLMLKVRDNFTLVIHVQEIKS